MSKTESARPGQAGKVLITADGLTAEGRVIRRHTTDPHIWLVDTAVGEHWVTGERIAFSQEADCDE